ncbi:phage DNA ejection protein [Providencia heimbachae]|uniref:phage DNA ejection protein n=1 Tax=Providencia heimbachae TaxID=333962 RepID=UPI000837EFDC|nr:phage DNA ejection protein [Providencia heimbachae]
MATWNQNINSGGFLGGIGQVNSNAPQARDINPTLGLIRENNDLQRSGANNWGLQGLAGLSGVAQVMDQQKQQERLSEFQGKWGQAMTSNDTNAMRGLFAEYPEMREQITGGMDGINDDVKQSFGNIALGYSSAISSGNPEEYVRQNADEFRRLGIDPQEALKKAIDSPAEAKQFAISLGMRAVTPERFMDMVDADANRVIKRDELTESARKADMDNARGIRGQNLSYQSAMTGHSIAAQRLQLDNEIKKSDMQEKALDRRLQREKNELEREKLQQQIGEVRDKSAAAKNEKLNSVVSSLDDLNSALSVGKELESHVNEHPSVVSRNQGGVLGKLPNFTDDTKTLAAKTDEYNLKVVLPALRGTFGGNPTEGERTALMQSQNNLKNATSQEDYLRELNKSQDVIMGMQKRQIKSLGIPVTKSNDEATDVQMLLSDPALVGEYVKTYGYLPDDYYKLKRGGK